jgi:hypothetical protein
MHGDVSIAMDRALNGEVKAEELADPLVLWHGGEALIQQELKSEVVGADEEVPTPEIGTPMANSLHEANQLVLIGCQLEVAAAKGRLNKASSPSSW